jgi:hypothetical protein
VSGIDTAVVDSLKVLDLKWPIREADIDRQLMRDRIGYLPPVRVRRDKSIRRGSG